MEFRLLGPVELWRNGRRIQLTGRKLRSLLAMLLLNVGRTVPAERLVRVLWAADLPASAPRLLQHHVSSLRTLLPDPALLSRTSGGYALGVRPETIDLHRFDAGHAAGRRALRDGDAGLATERLAAALALWRGPALSGATDELVRAFGPGLEERWLAAICCRIDADLRLGRCAEVLAELGDLGREHPLDERLRAQLILALAQAGRKADAVDSYHEFRGLLAEELGIEPGEAVQRAYRRVRGPADPSVHPEVTMPAAAGTAPGATDGRTAAPADPPEAGAPDSRRTVDRPRVPRQLPAAVRDLVGHTDALARLHGLHADGSGLIAIAGPAGVGKTALAVHWSHAVAGQFPDGQLFAELRGYDRDEPVPAYAVIGAFLRALGTPASEVPADQAELAALYRTLLADRRVLVVLDNVRSADQVRPLLPGGASCLVVVTSRDELAGLVARDGARRVTLAPISDQEGQELLRRTLGAARVAAEPGAASALTALCGGLPLALRLAAERIDRRPDTRLSSLLGELQRTANRLDALDAAGDPAAAVRATFSWSYLALSPAAARVFRLLGLHPGLDVDAPAAANLAGIAESEARRLLGTLAAVHLLAEATPGRFQLHDLLRAYAQERCRTDETAPERRAAFTRLLAGQLAAAGLAMDFVEPHRRQLASSAPQVPPAVPVIDGYDAALAWLDTERPTLVAAIRHAVHEGHLEAGWQLAHTLWRYFLLGRHIDEWIASYRLAVRAARQAGDRRAEVELLSGLASAYTHVGRSAEAIELYQRVIPLMRGLGDRRGEANSIGNLGTAYHRTGHYAVARERYVEALALFTEEKPRDRAFLLGNIADISYLLGDYPDAIHHYGLSLAVSREAEDRYAEGFARLGLGSAYRELGRLDEAGTQLEYALRLSRERSDQYDEALCLGELGLLWLRRGATAEAARYLMDALHLGRRINEPNLMAMVLTGLGDTTCVTQQVDEAGRHYREALDLAERAGDRHQQAYAHRGLARYHRLSGDLADAEAHRRQAAELFAELGLVELPAPAISEPAG